MGGLYFHAGVSQQVDMMHAGQRKTMSLNVWCCNCLVRFVMALITIHLKMPHVGFTKNKRMTKYEEV